MRTLSILFLVLASTGCQPTSDGSNNSDLPHTQIKPISIDPLGSVLETVSSNDIASLSIEMTDFSAVPNGSKEKINLLSEAEKMLPLLKKSRLINSGQIGVGMDPIGYMTLVSHDGDQLDLDLYPFGFFISGKEKLPTVYVYSSELTHFWNALKYDSNNRVYSESAYRDLLFEYASNTASETSAFSELTDFKDTRVITLVPDYLSRTDSVFVLLTLKNLENIDDPSAIAAVCRHLYSDSINTSRFAADVLESWGQIDELHRHTFSPDPADRKNSSGNSFYFCTHMACWYSENGKYSNAVKTIRAHGLDRFQLSGAFCLLRPLHPRSDDSFGMPDPKPTELERLEILLLMADLVEKRSGDLNVSFLHNLWEALGVQYDIDVEKMISRNEDTEDFFRNEHDGKKAADAIREWLGQQAEDM